MASMPTVFEIAGKYLAAYEGFYKQADPHFKGIISAGDAASFLKRSNMSNAVLGKVWDVADQNKNGYLDKVGFFAALKLIACAQHGLEIATSHLTADLPPPTFAGQADSPSTPMFGSTQDSIEWAIQAKERQKYDEIFETLGPTNGKLNGDQVKPVLLNSGLPTDVLGKIWELSDIDKDGFLDRDEMSVALHLVYRALENDPIPAALPLAMVPPSKRGAAGRRSTLAGSVQVLPPHPRQMTHKSRASSVTSIDSVGQGPQSPNIASRSLSGTPVPAPVVVKPPAPWIVDKSQWEMIFHDADKDHDGLVHGADVMGIFLQSGLSQMYLAHIWNLCDINSTGTLNLEQFALAMHFIDTKRHNNVEPPASLPPDLIPPSFRPNPAGMTDIATNTSHETSAELNSSFGSAKSSGNKEIDHISKEIAELQRERREFEQRIMQLESDMTVKQSEIRNLEAEFRTLEATVGQLERQKGEAQKRLDELENQRSNLRNVFNELARKNETEQNDVRSLRAEVENSTATMKNQEEVLNEKRLELQTLRDEEARLEVKLRMQNVNLQTATQRDAAVEGNIQKTQTNVQKLRDQRAGLLEKLTKLEEIIRSGDAAALDSDDSLLIVDELPVLESAMPSYPQHQPPPQQFAPATNPAAFDDPFASHDPFAQQDPFANADPFAASSTFDDPFAGSAAFSNLDSFGGSNNVQDSWTNKPPSPPKPVGGASKKTPPPRPVPPKNRPVTPKDPTMAAVDPFGGNAPVDPFSGGAGGGGFADFADFSKFS